MGTWASTTITIAPTIRSDTPSAVIRQWYALLAPDSGLRRNVQAEPTSALEARAINSTQASIPIAVESITRWYSDGSSISAP